VSSPLLKFEENVKVRIKNFQSIEDVSFEIPENAFTCIVGPSNIGKSALRRALECLFYNKSEASYIRNGTQMCSVEVSFDDNTLIKWYRNKKTAGYQIDGDDFTKLAGTVPDVLIDKGFKELNVNKDRYQVQIASQFNNIFLLNQTGSKITEVLSNLGNLNRIIKSNKACQSDLKMNKSRLNIRREDIISSKEKLKGYKGLDLQRHQVDIMKMFLLEIKDSLKKLSVIKKIEISLKRAVSLVKLLRPAREISVVSFDLDLNKLTILKKLLRKLVYSSDLIDFYVPIKSVPKIEFNVSVDILIALKKLHTKYSFFILKKEDYYNLLKIPNKIEFNLKEEYDKYRNMLDYLRKMETVQNKIKLYINFSEYIPTLEVFNIPKLEKLNSLYISMIQIKNKVIMLRDQLKIAEEKRVRLNEEKDILHKTLGVCPLCDKEF